MSRDAAPATESISNAPVPEPMHASPRCGARTRAGPPCRAPAVKGKRRCRMHGGAAGSGASMGNRNALTHGLTTAEAKAERRWIRALIRASRKVLREMG